jgi:hypothetical protein
MTKMDKEMTTIDTDYLIIGAGAVGLAFADTILTESDASITIVDRHGKPGGHWNDAYSFVSLHQPSAFYGVNSVSLGENRKDTGGLNDGYYELASGPDISGYFDTVVNKHFLPSGRVNYFPMSDYRGDGRFVSLLSGAETQVKVNRKIVDATFYGTTVPSTHKPKFDIADNARFAPPNALPHLWKDASNMPSHYCILGAGKTAMDVGVWLLNSGAQPDQISWVMPRDSWLLNRHHTQPGPEFFHETMGVQAAQVEALATATSIDDLFLKLEASGMMIRIYEDQRPTMYHCATISVGEIDLLRQIKNVLRQGHVGGVDGGGITFKSGDRASMPDNTLFIDCTASAVEKRDPVPVFQGNTITLQMIRTCQPAFSAALAAHVELNYDDDAKKNSLTGVVPLPDGLNEFLPVTLTNMMNQFAWSQEPDLRKWMHDSRLDGFSKVVAGIQPHETDKKAVMQKFREFAAPAIGNMQKLMAQTA